MSSPITTSTTVHLTATYTSPNTQEGPQILSSAPLNLPPQTAQTVESKTTYLRALRAATTALQDRINAELTARMEEDNRRNAQQQQGNAGTAEGKANGAGGVTAKKNTTRDGSAAAAVIDEAAEEENYGEEIGEEEE